MTDEMPGRREMLAGAAAAAAAVNMPELDVRRMLGGVSGGLQPTARVAGLGAPRGALDGALPPDTWDLADGYGDGPVDQAELLRDFVHLGIPNGDFAMSDADDGSSDYWALTDGTQGSWSIVEDVTAQGGYVLRYTSTTTVSSAPLATAESARIPVADMHRYAVTVMYDNDHAAKSCSIQAYIQWYDEAGTLLSTTSGTALTSNLVLGDGQVHTWTDIPRNTDTVNAATASVLLEVSHAAAGAASQIDLRVVALLPLKPASMLLDPDEEIQLETGGIDLVDGDLTLVTGDLTVVAGDTTLSGLVTVEGRITIGGVGIITPNPAVGQDDWNPSGFSTCNWVRMDASASISITGLAAQEDSRLILFTNISGSFNVTLVHASGLSLAANRFLLSGAANLVLGPYEGTWIIYDGVTNRWRAVR